jgi:hypothetical protein
MLSDNMNLSYTGLSDNIFSYNSMLSGDMLSDNLVFMQLQYNSI